MCILKYILGFLLQLWFPLLYLNQGIPQVSLKSTFSKYAQKSPSLEITWADFILLVTSKLFWRWSPSTANSRLLLVLKWSYISTYCLGYLLCFFLPGLEVIFFQYSDINWGLLHISKMMCQITRKFKTSSSLNEKISSQNKGLATLWNKSIKSTYEYVLPIS